MAERWQQWMPFHIDRWKGSAHVQAMRAAARSGYLYLLSAMWQTCDCTLPDDPDDLLVLSGLLADEWAEFSRVILKRFTLVDGRWTNSVLREEWSNAKRVFEARQSSAHRTNTVRTSHGDRNGDRHAEPTHKQEQEHIQEQKKEKDPRKRDVANATKLNLSGTGITHENFTSYLAVRKQAKKPFPDDNARDKWLERMRVRYSNGFDTGDMLDQMLMSSWIGPVEEKWKKRIANNGFLDPSKVYE